MTEAIDFEERGNDEQLAALYGALASARSEFTPIRKNRTVQIKGQGGAYSFDYAEFDVSLDATMPALSRNGLTVLQPVGNGVLRTILGHKGGARIIAAATLPQANDIKTLGGYITYLKRYCYNALLCLAADVDMDDIPEAKRGEATATSQAKATPQQQRQEAPAARPLGSTSATTSTTPGNAATTTPSATTQRDEPPTQEQKDQIRSLAKAAGVTNGVQMAALIKDLAGVAPDALTHESAKKVIAMMLQRSIDQKEGRT